MQISNAQKLAIARSAVCWISFSGAAKIAHSIIDNNAFEPETLAQKVKLLFGTAALCSVVGGVAKQHAGTQFDEAVETVREFQALRAARSAE